MKKMIQLFLTFLKIGLFTFGGGYAMIPLIQEEIVNKKHWIKDDDILDIVAIAESTPGPIAVNSATFVGYHVGGFIGAFVSTLGVVIPSFIIIVIVSYVLEQFESLMVVKYAFAGIRAGVLALIIKAMISMYNQSEHNWFAYFIIAFAFILTAFAGVTVIYVILMCALFGLLYSYIFVKEVK